MAKNETSIWKKEISFRRKPQEPLKAKVAAPAPAAVAAAKPVKPVKSETSVWKKEISFGRKGKAKRAAVKAPAPVAPAGKRQLPVGVTLPPVSAPAHVPATPAAELLRPVASEEAEAPAAPAADPAPAPAPAPAPMPEERLGLGDLVPEATERRKPSRKERKQLEQGQKAAAKAAAQAEKNAPRELRDSHRRHKKLVGLKIGATQLAAAHISNNGSPRLLGVAQSPLRPGVVVGGELRDPDELASALKAFFRKNRLPRTKVRLGIANNRIAVRVFDIAGIDDPQQLANAIRFRAQDALPIPLEEAVLDYRVLRETVGEDGLTTRRVLLVVAHRELVERYVAACRKAGLKLVGIDLEAFALLRALTPPGAPVGASEDAGLVVVSIGHERSTLAVSDGTACEFTRVLEWGGVAIDAAIARALEVDLVEADRVKRSLSLADGAADPEGLTPVEAARARTEVRAELQSFARELIASLRFYQDQPGSLGIAEIVLAGGGSQLPGLDTALGALVGVGVRTGDPGLRLKTGRKLKKQQLGSSLAAAIGLGIED